MKVHNHDPVETIVKELKAELLERQRTGTLNLESTTMPEGLTARVADFIDAEVRPSGVAGRIGPVFTTERLAVLLAPSSDRSLTTEAMRKRASARHLVAFRSDDGRWLFPDWQFDRVHGRLHVNPLVIDLWRALPHGSWLDAIDLAVWMSDDREDLDGPVHHHVRTRGFDEPLSAALRRLHARVDGAST